MKRKTLYFTAPEELEVREESIESVRPEQVLVETQLSAISPGTEMLVYRGQFPEELSVDETIASLAGSFRYPLKYGYSCVGRIIETGARVDPAWQGRLVFSFHPHESHFVANLTDLIPVPVELSPEDAVFLPNMETAVNFLMDGRPMIGEFVAVFGLGIVGLLTTSLLVKHPLAGVVCFDRYEKRREQALSLGAGEALHPEDREGWMQTRENLRQQGMADGFDLVYELSGAPAALDQAIGLTGFAGRVVIGSWYGKKPVALNLGGRFHRSRIRLISSQVSSLDPQLLGRWTKSRRLGVAWEVLRQLRPARWITHQFCLEQAGQAYHCLAEHPEDTIQVVFRYA